jgi:NADPH-dependent 2,4-dienoyl-CoA reductase/sulfur reductase-like enzyme
LEAIPLSPILGDDFGLAVQKRHEKEGVQFHLNRSVQDLIGDQRISGVLLSDGEILECDLLIEAVGSQTNTEWLEGNNLDIGNGVLTDNSLRAMRIDKSRVEDLFVVGDIARFPYVNIALPARRIEHWNIPVECGKRVGREISAIEGSESSSEFKQDEHFNPLPSFWSDQFSISILSYGEPKIADTISLLEGSLDSEFIFEYRREGSVVAVAGIGMRRKISALREEIRL